MLRDYFDRMVKSRNRLSTSYPHSTLQFNKNQKQKSDNAEPPDGQSRNRLLTSYPQSTLEFQAKTKTKSDTAEHENRHVPL